MLSAVLVASIAVAVILGYKTKINTGFFCIAFAYLIGCFGMGLKTKELIGFWPVSTMFVILSVSLFYNFAVVNGTLEKMSASLLYMCCKFPGMLHTLPFWHSWHRLPSLSVRKQRWTS